VSLLFCLLVRMSAPSSIITLIYKTKNG